MTTPRNQESLAPHHVELAALLAAARRDAKQIPELPSELVPATPDDAYAVNRLTARLLGWELLGWKIAGTTAAMREKLRLDTPIHGRTYRRFAVDSPARFAFAELLDPLVESEFFVTLDRDLPAREAPWTLQEVAAAVGTVHAGIELAECRFPKAALPPLTAILADGSASGRYIFGDLIPDWRVGLADIAVTLEVDGAVRRRGSGAEVMGDPLRPLLWLAEDLRRGGDGLKAGETVSTGSTTGMLPVRAGQRIRAVFGDRAAVTVAFD
ncbi:MAG TPA: hydratase [Chloroflexota bacterium]|nr:hydratase [Chloroflexota bacterium]